MIQNSHKWKIILLKKLFKVSNHIGIVITGLTPDERLLYQYMKNQSFYHNHTFNTDCPIEKLVNKIADKSQLMTQRGESKRIYGVGLLIDWFDKINLNFLKGRYFNMLHSLFN